MFSLLKKPLYPHLPIGSNIFFNINEKSIYIDFNKFSKLIQEAINENDFSEALQLSTKLAIYFGPPGMIHYFDASISYLKYKMKKGEEIQQQGFNLLVEMFLTKKLLDIDENAKNIMNKLMPIEDANSNTYWKNKISKIVDLANLYGLKELAEKNSLHLLEFVKPDIMVSVAKS